MNILNTVKLPIAYMERQYTPDVAVQITYDISLKYKDMEWEAGCRPRQ